MESIYEPERFKSSEVVNLREYFMKFSNQIVRDLAVSSSAENDGGKPEECTDLLGVNIDSETLKSLEESCSIDQLWCDGEINTKPMDPPEHFGLRSRLEKPLPFTEQCSTLEVLKAKASIEKYKTCERILLLNRENFHNCVVDRKGDKDLPANLTPGGGIVMNVIFYKPFKYKYDEKNIAAKCRFNMEIQVLGENTLTELRDQIICASDCGLQLEVEGPTADTSHLMNAKEEYPSACFFINGVLYNDMRSPKAIEYSKEIIEWAHTRKVGTFTKADMHTTKIIDLSLRFGYPYLYMHQGDCEHLMVFSDAHILTKNDCLNAQRYPRLYAFNKLVGIICYMCNVTSAKWVVKNYERLPQSTTFLCKKCAERYCSKNGEKIGEYNIYPLFTTH